MLSVSDSLLELASEAGLDSEPSAERSPGPAIAPAITAAVLVPVVLGIVAEPVAELAKFGLVFGQSVLVLAAVPVAFAGFVAVLAGPEMRQVFQPVAIEDHS